MIKQSKALLFLAKAGVKAAFKLDHPVLNAQNLIFEAAKAVHYGFPLDLAIASVTSVPAEKMGQDCSSWGVITCLGTKCASKVLHPP
jgi:imidazolonepropionase-like amidohydrolase